MAGTYMKIFRNELRQGEQMSNDHMARVAKAEFEAEQQRKKRGLMAGSFNESANHLDWPKLDIGQVPQIDPITGRTIPSRPYEEPEPRIGTERTRQTDKVSDPVNQPARQHSHYFKDVSKLQDVDVYRICQLFGVDDPSGAIQHAIKKLLVSGKRGVKDSERDIREAVDTLNRRLQMIAEDCN